MIIDQILQFTLKFANFNLIPFLNPRILPIFDLSPQSRITPMTHLLKNQI